MSKRPQENENRKRTDGSGIAEEQIFRVACDRCHGQKLRCLREAETSTYRGCKRCHRAGVMCNTSPPRRMGRPLGTKAIQTSKPIPRIEPLKRPEMTKEACCAEIPMPDTISADSGLQWSEQGIFRTKNQRNGPFHSGNQHLKSPTPNTTFNSLPENGTSSQLLFSSTTASSCNTWAEPLSWNFYDLGATSANGHSISNGMPSWISNSMPTPSSPVSSLVGVRNLNDLFALESSSGAQNAYHPMASPWDSSLNIRTNEMDSSVQPIFKLKQNNLHELSSALQLEPLLHDTFSDYHAPAHNAKLHDNNVMEEMPSPVCSPENAQEPRNDPREECMLEFSRLNISLYRQLRKLKLNPWATKSPQHPRTTSLRDPIFEPGIQAFPVDDILTSSQDFLKLLNNFSPKMTRTTPNWATTSCSDSTNSSSISASGLFSNGDFDSELSFDMMGFETSSTKSSNASANDNANDEDLQLDTPTILGMLTCYIRLLRIYLTLFTHIHQSLLTRSPLFLKSLKLPSSLNHNPNPHLPNHTNLQTVVVVQMSIHFLNTIERVLRDLAGRELMDILLGMGTRGGEMACLRREIKRFEVLLKDHLGI